MNMLRIHCILSCVGTVCLVPALQAQDLLGDDIFELSPFMVTTSEDEGYSATSTLAGTRIKTNLEDVGSSISVITSQFLEDTGSTDLNDLLVYTANTEAGGVNGNFSASFSSGDAVAPGFREGTTAITDPQGAQRVRGLDAADVTRNLFRSSIKWDSYNIERVEIVRGASSILFGQGSPAGIINASTIKPFWKDTHKVSVRIDDQASLRASFDSNLVVLEDTLAIRAAGLYDHTDFRQEPTFDDDERIFLSGLWKINDNFKIRFEGEYGTIRANRPNPLAPIDGLSWYLENVGLAADPTPLASDNPRVDLLGRNFSAVAQPRIFVQWGTKHEANGQLVNGGLDPAVHSMQGSLNPNSIRANNAAGIPRLGRIYSATTGPWELDTNAGFRTMSFSDYSIFDWKNHSLAGNFPYQNADLHTANLALEFNSDEGHFGAELSYDYQFQEDMRNKGPTESRDYIVRLDVSAQNPDGSPNPNLFRPFLPLTQSMRGDVEIETEHEAMQLNAFAKFNVERDLGWESFWGRFLGTQTLTLFASSSEFSRSTRGYDDTYDAENIALNAGNGFTATQTLGHLQRDATAMVYLGGAIDSAADLSISPLRFTAQSYNPDGQVTTMRVWDKTSQDYRNIDYSIVRFLQAANEFSSETETFAAILQSDWWDGVLTTIAGIRRDSVANITTDYGFVEGTDRVRDLNAPTQRITEGEDSYFSWSAVLKSPRSWDLPLGTRASVFYSESENFDPSATGRLNLQGGAIAPPTGTTKDYGVRFSTFEDKLELKVNFYETTFSGSSFTGGGVVGASYIETDFRFRERTYTPGILDGYINPSDPVLGTFGEPSAALIAANAATLNEEGNYVFTVNNDVTDTSDITSEGMEIEIVYNPTRNWRMLLNVSRQETVRSNSLPSTRAYVASRLPAWETAYDYPFLSSTLVAIEDQLVRDAEGFVDWTAFARDFPERTRRADLESRVLIPLQAVIDQDGAPVQEQREWRFNLITNYTFNKDSRLGGFNVGAGVRWQDESAIGFPWKINQDGVQIIDVENPFFGPDQTNIDAWVGYKREIMDGKADWKIQLNVRNLFADDAPIPVTADNFGTHAQFMLPPFTTWAVTNTFSF